MYPLVDPAAGPIDFSKAIRLKELSFDFQRFGDVFIAMALGTLTPKHTDFQKVTILVPSVLVDESIGIRQSIGDEVYNQWMDLDRVLVRLWESNAIQTQVIYRATGGRGHIEALFPEMSKRGAVEMVCQMILIAQDLIA